MTITIIGSGISGLYTAYSLVENNVDAKSITIIGEYLPGDQSTFYTSPWAGGNFSCISPDDDLTMKLDKLTYQNLSRIQKSLGGPTCGLEQRYSVEYWDEEPSQKKLDSLKTYILELEVLKDLPKGAAYGIRYLSWNFNCPLFLENMGKYLKNKGVTIARGKLKHIAEAPGDVVFNCTGLGARFLGGVEDLKVYPTRGQVVVVKAPQIKENRMRWGPDYATYILPRPYSHDHVVLGGFLQVDNWTGDTFGYETEDILKRTIELYPEIGEPEVVRVAAGLRPSRKGGVRIEKERIGKKVVIHNYGASGYGYQAGYGMASEAVKLYLGSKL